MEMAESFGVLTVKWHLFTTVLFPDLMVHQSMAKLPMHPPQCLLFL